MSENLKPVEGKLDTSAKETKQPKERIVKVFLNSNIVNFMFIYYGKIYNENLSYDIIK